jgi:hypothetical protein
MRNMALKEPLVHYQHMQRTLMTADEQEGKSHDTLKFSLAA